MEKQDTIVKSLLLSCKRKKKPFFCCLYQDKKKREFFSSNKKKDVYLGDKKQKGGWSVNKSKKIQRCLEQNWIKSVFIYLEQPPFCWIKKKKAEKGR